MYTVTTGVYLIEDNAGTIATADFGEEQMFVAENFIL